MEDNKTMVYKYYAPTDYNLDALLNQYFWFSKRSNLNDPYEMNTQILETFPKFRDLLNKRGYDIDNYHKKVDEYAICSFTSSCDNQHFWSLYAQNFEGWCLEFNCDNLVDSTKGVINKLYDVVYLDEVPDLDDDNVQIPIYKEECGDTITMPIAGLLGNIKEAEKLFEYLLCIKNREIWESEKEKRLVLGDIYLKQHGKNDKNGYIVNWYKEALSRIIIGHKILDLKRKLIVLIAKELNVEVWEAKPDLKDRKFSIQINKI